MLPTPSNSWAVVQWYTWCVLFSMFVTIVLSISISIIHKAGEKYRNVTHVIYVHCTFLYIYLSQCFHFIIAVGPEQLLIAVLMDNP